MQENNIVHRIVANLNMGLTRCILDDNYFIDLFLNTQILTSNTGYQKSILNILNQLIAKGITENQFYIYIFWEICCKYTVSIKNIHQIITNSNCTDQKKCLSDQIINEFKKNINYDDIKKIISNILFFFCVNVPTLDDSVPHSINFTRIASVCHSSQNCIIGFQPLIISNSCDENTMSQITNMAADLIVESINFLMTKKVESESSRGIESNLLMILIILGFITIYLLWSGWKK